MAFKVSKIEVWTGLIEDRAGAVADVLGPLGAAGANLQFLLARRDTVGKGVVFLEPIKGAKLSAAAKAAGLAKATELQALRIEGPDARGVGEKLTKAVAEAGINLRGLVGLAVNKRCILYASFDSKQDASAAQRAITKALKK